MTTLKELPQKLFDFDVEAASKSKHLKGLNVLHCGTFGYGVIHLKYAAKGVTTTLIGYYFKGKVCAAPKFKEPADRRAVVRQMYDDGWKQAQIALLLGVSQSQISVDLKATAAPVVKAN